MATYEQYRIVHDQHLNSHPFIDQTRGHTLIFEEVDVDGPSLVHLEGDVYCLRGVTLIVEKWFETRVTRSGLLQVKGFLYRYIAYVRSGNLVLKYHNLHEDPKDYVHRIYDAATGKERFSEALARAQFPVMTGVLDELNTLTRNLHH